MIYKNHSSVSGLALFLCVALSACCSTVPQPEEEQTVTWIPPAHEMEQIPLLQDPTVEIWRPGYWSPGGPQGGFIWIPGRIIPRPSPTAIWRSARWVRHAYGWSFEQGHWQ